MPGYLKCIELEDFKSYKGKQMIGPFKNFTAIIGPNGSGKSNLMDAISFVLGERTLNLRVKKLQELIHGAPIGKPVSKTARVTAVYCDSAGNETHFTRVIQGNSSDFRINDESVRQSEYAEELEHIGIYLKSKNFLVFQGAVESIAMKSAKERTAIFEEMSRSIELKEEYERAKGEMNKAEEETQFSYHKKKGITAERKEAKLEMEEADKFQKLQEQRTDKEMELYLFKLFHNEAEISSLVEENSKKGRQLEKAMTRKDRVDHGLKELKKEQAKNDREMTKSNELLRTTEEDLLRKRPMFIKAKEKCTHMNKKLEGAKKSLQMAQQAHDKHESEVNELVKEMEEVDRQREEFEATVREDSQAQGRDLNLEETQLAEYERLKEEASKLASRYMQEFESLNRDQKLDRDKLDNELRKKTELSAKVQQKEHEIEDNKKRVEKLNDYISANARAVDDERRREAELSNDVESGKSRVSEINTELESVMLQLGEARVDKHESARAVRRAELIENLKRLFPGVHGRLMELCEPSHKKYQVAITKVLGKHMDGIVCDTEKTAKDCIQYMKEQRNEPETFLPVDYIDIKPLNEKLREIKEPRNVKLVMDVLKYEQLFVKKALLFACGNALVCETVDDARRVAFGGHERHKAIALDGTLFQKSGVISGGTSDLKAKARKWDEKAMNTLSKRKDKLVEMLKEQQRLVRKEPELATMRSQLKGLENRLKYSTQDRDNITNKHLVHYQQELHQFRQQYEAFQPRVTEIDTQMKERAAKMASVQHDKDAVDDTVFTDFCHEIGVENIRQYEERELAWQQDLMKKRLEYDNQKQRIANQLEYERSRDTMANVQKWKNLIQEDTRILESLKEDESRQLKVIEELMARSEEVKQKQHELRKVHNEKEKEIDGVKKEAHDQLKQVSSIQKSVNTLEATIEQKRGDRHSLLKTCKINAIDLPMEKGSMNDITQEGISDSQGGDSQSQSQMGGLDSLGSQDARTIYEREARIQLDYSQLAPDLKEIEDENEVIRKGDEIIKQINDMIVTMQRIVAPNMKAGEKMDDVTERLHQTSEALEISRRRANQAKQNFVRIKKERYDRFMKCLDHVANKIDDIYKVGLG